MAAGIAQSVLWADGSRLGPRWGRDSPQLSRPSPRPTQPPVQWVPGLFREGKAAEAWR